MLSPPGQRDARLAAARHERAEHVDRRPHPPHQLVGRLGLERTRRVDRELLGAGPLDGRPDGAQHVEHHVEIPDPRQVADVGDAGREQRGRELLEPGVLRRARDLDRPGQRPGRPDAYRLHRRQARSGPRSAFTAPPIRATPSVASIGRCREDVDRWTRPNRRSRRPTRWTQRLSAVERLLGPVLRPGGDAVRAVSDRVVTPAWNRVTGIESRVQVMSALAVAIALTALLPARVANHPRWLLPGLASILFVIVLLVNPLEESRAGETAPAADVRPARGGEPRQRRVGRPPHHRPRQRRGHQVGGHAAPDRRRDLGRRT